MLQTLLENITNKVSDSPAERNENLQRTVCPACHNHFVYTGHD